MLKLYYPAKPFNTTQAWGIYNPAYKQFGFTRHNGVDFRLGKDSKLYAPLSGLKVIETGNIPKGAGIFARMISQEKHFVGDRECYVEILFMHCEELYVKKGQILKLGDLVAKADNTGFSTGPHTHMLCRRLSSPYSDTVKTRLDTDKETNQTFDPSPYWTGFAAQDAPTLLGILQKIALLMR